MKGIGSGDLTVLIFFFLRPALAVAFLMVKSFSTLSMSFFISAICPLLSEDVLSESDELVVVSEDSELKNVGLRFLVFFL